MLTFGNAYDDALTTNYRHKIEKKEDLTVQDDVDAFVTSFDERSPDTEFLPSKVPDDLKKTGVQIVKEYQTVVAPKIKPVATQKYYNVKFPNVDWTLKGIADVEEENGTIRDNKTSGKSPSKNANGEYMPYSDDHKFQMLCYSISEKMDKGNTAGEELWLDYAIKNKYPKIIQVKVPSPTPEDLKYFQMLTSIAVRKIELLKKGTLPALPNRGNMLCSKKYCGYWALCEKDFGGTVKN